MSDLARYTLRSGPSGFFLGLYLKSDGAWVKHADHEAEVARLTALLRETEKVVGAVASRVPGWRDAVADWDNGGEAALYDLDESSEILDALLARLQEPRT